jgi:nucleotide-binding universal stress UspA family protein
MEGQTIAVGVGGTDASWPTLAWAVADAAVTGARLLVTHVPLPDSPLRKHGHRVRLAELELADPPLARAISAARDRLGGHRVELAIAHGHVGEALVLAADDADLMVLGAPQRAGWFNRGSTTHYVITHAHTPVVVVRSVTDPTRGPLAGHVVVGVDGSAAARAALEFGFEYAATHRRPLAAVHVSADDREDIWLDETTLETHLVDVSGGLVMLADEVEPWHFKYPAVPVRRALYGGQPVPGLPRAATGAHLLVVGNRGRGVVARTVLGSVSHGCVDQAPCPVAIARTDRVREERVR